MKMQGVLTGGRELWRTSHDSHDPSPIFVNDAKDEFVLVSRDDLQELGEVAQELLGEWRTRVSDHENMQADTLSETYDPNESAYANDLKYRIGLLENLITRTQYVDPGF